MKTRKMLKKVFAFTLAMLLLCLTACQSDQEAIYSKYTAEESSEPVSSTVQSDASEPVENGTPDGDTLSGELTISELYAPISVGRGTGGIVEAFEKEHPNVKITIDYAVPEGESLTEAAISAYSQRLVTEFMSGETADIISYYSGTPSARDIAQNGYAMDLYEWMDKDPDFHKDDYFSNIFDALEFNGKLYQMPVLFYANVLILNARITTELGYTFEPWECVDYGQVIDIYREAAERGLLAEDFTMEYMDYQSPGSVFAVASTPDFFDEQAKTVRYDSPEFIQYLEDTKHLPSNRKLADGVTGMGGGQAIHEFAQSNAQANTSLTFSTAIQMMDFPNIGQAIEGATPPLLLSSKNGKCTYYSTLQYMIPSSCKNPELAWEFLKFSVSHVEQPGYYNALDGTDFVHGFFPLEKENFRAYAKLYVQVDEASRKDPEGWAAAFDPQTAPCSLDGSFFEEVEWAIGKFNAEVVMPTPLAQVLQPILVQYYDTDSLSAENCARQMQERAEIFLAE